MKNKLFLDIGQETASGSQTLLLFIDNIEFRRIVIDNSSAAFFDEFYDSFQKPGSYLIFTCTCGVADCGGWEKVNVLHHADTIEWFFSYNQRDYHFIFLKENYESELYKIKDRLTNTTIKLLPDFIVDPE